MGTTHDTAKFTHVEEGTPAGETPPRKLLVEPWPFKDPEKIFTDYLPANEEKCPRSFLYYQDYPGKYGTARMDSLDFYSRKFMIHHRLEKYSPVIRIGTQEIMRPVPQNVSGTHVFVFQPEKRQEEVRRLCQQEQSNFGSRVKHEGSTHRDFIV